MRIPGRVNWPAIPPSSKAGCQSATGKFARQESPQASDPCAGRHYGVDNIKAFQCRWFPHLAGRVRGSSKGPNSRRPRSATGMELRKVEFDARGQENADIKPNSFAVQEAKSSETMKVFEGSTVRQSLALASIKKSLHGRSAAEPPTAKPLQNRIGLKVDIDDDTAVPMDLYMSLMEGAGRARCGQHVLRDVNTGCMEGDSQAPSRSSKNQRRLVRND